MVRPILAVAFVLAALAPEASALAQQSTQQNASHSTSASRSTSSKSSQHANHGHNMHQHSPPWANSVYVNGGTAAQYLATSTPKPPPGKNKVNKTGTQVFKSISN